MSELISLYEAAGLRVIVDGIKEKLLSKLFFELPDEEQTRLMTEIFREMKDKPEYKKVTDVIVNHYEESLSAYFANTRSKCEFCKGCECVKGELTDGK